MWSVSALIAALPLMVLGAVGQGVGYISIRQPPTSSETVRSIRPNQQPAQRGALASDDVGDNGSALHSQAGGSMAQTQYDWDLEQRLTEAAPAQHLGTAGSKSAVTTSNFSNHGRAEDAKRHVPAFQLEEQAQQHQHRVALRNMDSVQYFGDMMVGEPPQRMKVSGSRYL